MSTKEEISKAISAHGSWKMKLRNAIDTGESESTPERVKRDCNCAFGKWLYERIDPEAKSSPYYEQVRQLHAEFHQEAGSILELALKGQKEEATARIQLTSQFAKCSGQLTRTMQAWQQSL